MHAYDISAHGWIAEVDGSLKMGLMIMMVEKEEFVFIRRGVLSSSLFCFCLDGVVCVPVRQSWPVLGSALGVFFSMVAIGVYGRLGVSIHFVYV